jgi:hypothetical protein
MFYIIENHSNIVGLSEAYTKKTNLREVECKHCGKMIATRMVNPRCRKCGKYTKEE